MKKELRFAAVGDMMLGDHYFTIGHGVGSKVKAKGLSSIVDSNVSDYLNKLDIVFSNLEAPLSNESEANSLIGRQVFRCESPEVVARSIRSIGVNIVNVANNHILQHGDKAYFETVNALLESNIGVIGVSQNIDGYLGSKPYVYTARGLSVGLLGYSDVLDKYNGDNLYAVYDHVKVVKDLANIRKNVDFVVVSIHCGVEAELNVDGRTKEIADYLSKHGVDLILFHHSHVFLPIKKVGGSLVAYGLGDFIFDLHWCKALYHSNILEFLFADKEVSLVRELPIVFDKNYKLRFLLRSRDGKQSVFKELCLKYGEHMKVLFFFKNIFKGDTVLKLVFLYKKIMGDEV